MIQYWEVEATKVGRRRQSSEKQYLQEEQQQELLFTAGGRGAGAGLLTETNTLGQKSEITRQSEEGWFDSSQRLEELSQLESTVGVRMDKFQSTSTLESRAHWDSEEINQISTSKKAVGKV